VTTIRAFVALPVPAVVGRVAANARTLCTGIDGVVRWVAPERIHLTVKFLGDMDDGNVPAIHALLTETAAATGPFRLAVGGLGVFPSVKNPRVLWMGITGDTPALVDFARQLDTALTTLGFAAESRPFRAHLTLGRFKAKTDPQQLVDIMASGGEMTAASFLADRVVLYQSELKPSGAVYTPLTEVPLSGGDGASSRPPDRHS